LERVSAAIGRHCRIVSTLERIPASSVRRVYRIAATLERIPTSIEWISRIVTARSLESARNLPVGIRDTQAMGRIVCPGRTVESGVSAMKSITVESIVMEEVIVDED
jgi:hypothetical protein